ncbi:Uncharacterized protein QTN25_008002 [Entamoeba marina]
MQYRYLASVMSYCKFNVLRTFALVNKKCGGVVKTLPSTYVMDAHEWCHYRYYFNFTNHLTLSKNREPISYKPNQHISSLKLFALSLYDAMEVQSLIVPTSLTSLHIQFVDSLGPFRLSKFSNYVNLESLSVSSFTSDDNFKCLTSLKHLKSFSSRSFPGDALPYLTRLTHLEAADDGSIGQCKKLKSLYLHLNHRLIDRNTYPLSFVSNLTNLKKMVLNDDMFRNKQTMIELEDLHFISHYVSVIFIISKLIVATDTPIYNHYPLITFIFLEQLDFPSPISLPNSSMSILQPTNTYLKNKKPLVGGLCFKEYDTFSLNAYLRRFETNAIQLTNCSIQWKLINISTIQSIHKLEINETKQFDFKNC